MLELGGVRVGQKSPSCFWRLLLGLREVGRGPGRGQWALLSHPRQRLGALPPAQQEQEQLGKAAVLSPHCHTPSSGMRSPRRLPPAFEHAGALPKTPQRASEHLGSSKPFRNEATKSRPGPSSSSRASSGPWKWPTGGNRVLPPLAAASLTARRPGSDSEASSVPPGTPLRSAPRIVVLTEEAEEHQLWG